MKYGYTIVVGDVKNYPCLRSGNLYENLQEALEVKADSVEIHLADPDGIDVHKVKYVIKNQLAISAIGTGLSCGKYGLSLTSDDQEIVWKSQDHLFHYINLAKEFGAAVIFGSIRGKNTQNLPLDEYEKLLLKNMTPVIEYAGNKRVDLVFETINRYELMYYNSIPEMARLIKTINHPNVKIHIDTFHMNIEDTSVYTSVARLKGILGHVHLADNTRLEPGTGTFNFKALVNALDDIGYDKSVSMECFNPKGERTAIINGLNFMRKI